MSIPETYHFDKAGEVEPVGWRMRVRKYFLTLAIILVAILSFGIGRLTGSPKLGVSMNYEQVPNDQGPSTKVQSDSTLSLGPSDLSASPSVFASSKGTRYYYSGCRNTISDKNKVTFATAAMAEQAGYTLASGCVAPH